MSDRQREAELEAEGRPLGPWGILADPAVSALLRNNWVLLGGGISPFSPVASTNWVFFLVLFRVRFSFCGNYVIVNCVDGGDQSMRRDGVL